MNSFASSDQKDFDQLAAAGNRISHGINNVHNDLNQTNDLIKSGFSQQGGILSTIRTGISSVGQGIANVYNRNKEDYGVNTQEFSKRVAAMAGGPIGLAVRDVIANSGVSIGNVVKKSVGGITNMFHGHRNNETQILDNDLNKLNTLNNRQLRASNEQTEAIRDGNKILGELRNIARGGGSIGNVSTGNTTQRTSGTSRGTITSGGGVSTGSNTISSGGIGGSGSPSEVINLLREIADNQKNLKNVFTDPEGKEEPGIFKTLAKEIISMPFGFKYWFSGRYAKDIKRSNNPLETIVNALIKMYEWERIGIDLSRRQLNQLIKAAGGQEQKYVGHEGTMITAVKRASGAIKQGAVKAFGNNAFGRMMGSALNLPLAFLRFGEQDFEDQQYLKAYQVGTGLGKSRQKGLGGFWQNITGGDRDFDRLLYSERNVRKTIDELLGGDFDNSELNRRTFNFKRSFDREDDKKIERILRDPELLEAIQVLNKYRSDSSANDENIKLDIKDLRRLITKKIGDYGLDGIHGSRIQINSLLKGIKSRETLLGAKDSDFTIQDLFTDISTSTSRKAEDREYIKELEKILNDPDAERSEKLSASQELKRIEAELNSRVLATGGVINKKADIISEKSGKKIAEIAEKGQRESVVPFDDTPEGKKTLQELGAAISRYVSGSSIKVDSKEQPLTSRITPVVPIGLTPKIVAQLVKDNPGIITRKNFPKKIDSNGGASVPGVGGVVSSILGKQDKGEALDGSKNNEELLIDSETEQTKFLKGIYETLDKKISKGLKVDKKDKSSIFDGTLGGLLGGLGSIAGGLVSGVVGAAGSLISSVLSVAATLARFGAGVAALAGSVYVAAEAIRGIKSLFDKLFPGAAGENPGNVISTSGALLQTANGPKNAVNATAAESARQVKATSERLKGVKALEAGANEQVLNENLDTAKAQVKTAEERVAQAKARESTLNERYRRYSEGTLEPGEKPPTQSELDAAKNDRVAAEKASAESQAKLSEAQSKLDQFKKNTPKKTRRAGAKRLQELPPEQQAQIKASQRIFQMAGKELPELSTKIRQTEGIIKSAKENPDAFDQEFVKSLEEQLKLLKERYNFVKELGKPISAQAQAEYAQALEVNRAALQLQQSKLYRFGTKALDVAGKFGYSLQALGGTVSLIQHLNNHDYLRAMVDTVNYNPNPAAALTAGLVGADADSSSATLREMYGGRFDPHVASDQVYYGTRAFTPIVGDVMTGAGAGVNALFGRNGRIVAGSMLRNTNTYKLVRAGQDLKGLSASLETLRLASPAERAAVGFTGRLAKMPLSKLGGPLLQAFMFGLDVKEASTDFSNGDYVGGGLSTGAAIFGGVGLAATLTAAAASGTAAGAAAGPVAIICGIGAALISGIKWGWDRNKTQKAKNLYYKNKSAFTDTRLYSDEELSNELNDFCSENTDILKRGEKQVEIYNRYLKKYNIHPLEEFYHTMLGDKEFLLAYKGLYLSLKRMYDEAERQLRQDQDFYERDLDDQHVMLEMAEHRIYAMMAPLYEEFIKNIASKNSDLGKSIDLSALESALKPVTPNIKPGETYMAAPGWQPRPHFTQEQKELKKHYRIFKNPNSYSPEQVSFSTAYIARYLEKMQQFQISYQDQFGDFHGNGQTRDSFFQDILYKYDSKYDDYFKYKDKATIQSDYIKIIRKIIEDDDFAKDFLKALCEFNRITGPFEMGTRTVQRGIQRVTMPSNIPIPVQDINDVLKDYKLDVYLTTDECYEIAAILSNLSGYIEKIKRNEQGAIYEKARLENEYGADAFLDAQTENLSLEKNADRQYLTSQLERLKGIIHKYTKDKKPLEDRNGFLTEGYHEEGSVQRAHIPGSQKKAYGDTDNKPGLFEDSTYISGFLDDGTPVKISKSDNVLLTERLSGFTESGTPFEVGESGPEVISNGTVIPVGDNPEAKIAQDRINRVSSELLKDYKHDADAETGTPAVAEAAANQALQLAAQQPEEPKAQPEQKSPTTPELTPQSKRTQAANEVVQNLAGAANPNKITSKEDRLRFAMENAALAAQQSIDVNVSEINKIADKLFSEVKKGNKDSKGFFDTAKDFFTGNFNFKELLEKGFDTAKDALSSAVDSMIEFDDDFISNQVNSNSEEVLKLKSNPTSKEAQDFLASSGVGSFEAYEALDNKEKYKALKKSTNFKDRIRSALDTEMERYAVSGDATDDQLETQAAAEVVQEYKDKNKGISKEKQQEILDAYKKTEEYKKLKEKPSTFEDIDTKYIAQYLDGNSVKSKTEKLKGYRDQNREFAKPNERNIPEYYRKAQEEFNEGFESAKKKADEDHDAIRYGGIPVVQPIAEKVSEPYTPSQVVEPISGSVEDVEEAKALQAEEDRIKAEEASLAEKAKESFEAEENRALEAEEEADLTAKAIAAAEEAQKAQEDHDAIRASEGPAIQPIAEAVSEPYTPSQVVEPISGASERIEEAKALQAEEDLKGQVITETSVKLPVTGPEINASPLKPEKDQKLEDQLKSEASDEVLNQIDLLCEEYKKLGYDDNQIKYAKNLWGVKLLQNPYLVSALFNNPKSIRVAKSSFAFRQEKYKKEKGENLDFSQFKIPPQSTVPTVSSKVPEASKKAPAATQPKSKEAAANTFGLSEDTYKFLKEYNAYSDDSIKNAVKIHGANNVEKFPWLMEADFHDDEEINEARNKHANSFKLRLEDYQNSKKQNQKDTSSNKKNENAPIKPVTASIPKKTPEAQTPVKPVTASVPDKPLNAAESSGKSLPEDLRIAIENGANHHTTQNIIEQIVRDKKIKDPHRAETTKHILDLESSVYRNYIHGKLKEIENSDTTITTKDGKKIRRRVNKMSGNVSEMDLAEKLKDQNDFLKHYDPKAESSTILGTSIPNVGKYVNSINDILNNVSPEDIIKYNLYKNDPETKDVVIDYLRDSKTADSINDKVYYAERDVINQIKNNENLSATQKYISENLVDNLAPNKYRFYESKYAELLKDPKYQELRQKYIDEIKQKVRSKNKSDRENLAKKNEYERGRREQYRAYLKSGKKTPRPSGVYSSYSGFGSSVVDPNVKVPDNVAKFVGEDINENTLPIPEDIGVGLNLSTGELIKKVNFDDSDFADGGYEGFSDKPILEENADGSRTLSSEAGMEAKIKLADGGSAFIPMNSQHTTMMQGLQKYIAEGIANNGVVPGSKSYKAGTTYSTDSGSESMKRKLANDLLAGVRGKFAEGGTEAVPQIPSYLLANPNQKDSQQNGMSFHDAISTSNKINSKIGTATKIAQSSIKLYNDGVHLSDWYTLMALANNGLQLFGYNDESGIVDTTMTGVKYADIGQRWLTGKYNPYGGPNLNFVQEWNQSNALGKVAVGVNVASALLGGLAVADDINRGEYFDATMDATTTGMSLASLAGHGVGGLPAIAINLAIQDAKMIHKIIKLSGQVVKNRYIMDAEDAAYDVEFMLKNHNYLKKIDSNKKWSQDQKTIVIGKTYFNWTKFRGDFRERSRKALSDAQFLTDQAENISAIKKQVKDSILANGHIAALYTAYNDDAHRYHIWSDQRNSKNLNSEILKKIYLDWVNDSDRQDIWSEYDKNPSISVETTDEIIRNFKDGYSQLGQDISEGWNNYWNYDPEAHRPKIAINGGTMAQVELTPDEEREVARSKKEDYVQHFGGRTVAGGQFAEGGVQNGLTEKIIENLSDSELAQKYHDSVYNVGGKERSGITSNRLMAKLDQEFRIRQWKKSQDPATAHLHPFAPGYITNTSTTDVVPLNWSSYDYPEYVRKAIDEKFHGDLPTRSALNDILRERRYSIAKENGLNADDEKDSDQIYYLMSKEFGEDALRSILSRDRYNDSSVGGDTGSFSIENDMARVYWKKKLQDLAIKMGKKDPNEFINNITTGTGKSALYENYDEILKASYQPGIYDLKFDGTNGYKAIRKDFKPRSYFADGGITDIINKRNNSQYTLDQLADIPFTEASKHLGMTQEEYKALSQEYSTQRLQKYLPEKFKGATIVDPLGMTDIDSSTELTTQTKIKNDDLKSDETYASQAKFKRILFLKTKDGEMVPLSDYTDDNGKQISVPEELKELSILMRNPEIMQSYSKLKTNNDQEKLDMFEKIVRKRTGLRDFDNDLISSAFGGWQVGRGDKSHVSARRRMQELEDLIWFNAQRKAFLPSEKGGVNNKELLQAAAAGHDVKNWKRSAFDTWSMKDQMTIPENIRKQLQLGEYTPKHFADGGIEKSDSNNGIIKFAEGGFSYSKSSDADKLFVAAFEAGANGKPYKEVSYSDIHSFVPQNEKKQFYKELYESYQEGQNYRLQNNADLQSAIEGLGISKISSSSDKKEESSGFGILDHIVGAGKGLARTAASPVTGLWNAGKGVGTGDFNRDEYTDESETMTEKIVSAPGKAISNGIGWIGKGIGSLFADGGFSFEKSSDANKMIEDAFEAGVHGKPFPKIWKNEIKSFVPKNEWDAFENALYEAWQEGQAYRLQDNSNLKSIMEGIDTSKSSPSNSVESSEFGILDHIIGAGKGLARTAASPVTGLWNAGKGAATGDFNRDEYSAEDETMTEKIVSAPGKAIANGIGWIGKGIGSLFADGGVSQVEGSNSVFAAALDKVSNFGSNVSDVDLTNLQTLTPVLTSGLQAFAATKETGLIKDVTNAGKLTQFGIQAAKGNAGAFAAKGFADVGTLGKFSKGLGVAGAGLSAYNAFKEFKNGEYLSGTADALTAGVGAAQAFGAMSNPVGLAATLAIQDAKMMNQLYSTVSGTVDAEYTDDMKQAMGDVSYMTEGKNHAYIQAIMEDKKLSEKDKMVKIVKHYRNWKKVNNKKSIVERVIAIKDKEFKKSQKENISKLKETISEAGLKPTTELELGLYEALYNQYKQNKENGIDEKIDLKSVLQPKEYHGEVNTEEFSSSLAGEKASGIWQAFKDGWGFAEGGTQEIVPLASGGVVQRPIIGEKGQEAVIPFNDSVEAKQTMMELGGVISDNISNTMLKGNPVIIQDMNDFMKLSKGTAMKLAGETYSLDTQAGKIGSEQIIDGLKENATSIANSNSAMIYKIAKGGNSSSTVNNIVYNNPDEMYKVAEGSPRNIRA